MPETVVDALDPGIDSQRSQLLAVGLLILPNLAVLLFKGFQPRSTYRVQRNIAVRFRSNFLSRDMQDVVIPDKSFPF